MKQPVQTSAPLFPIDALPPKTRQLVGEIQQLSHASESTIVSAMLSAVATTAQRRYYIQHEDRRITRPQLFFVSVDDTGAVKNEVFRYVFHGLHHHEMQSNLRFQEKLATYEEGKKRLLNYIDQLSQAQSPPTSGPELDKVIQQLNYLQNAEPQKSKLIYSGYKDPQLLKQVREGNSVLALINPEADAIFSVPSLKNLDQLCRAWDVQDLSINAPVLGEPKRLVLERSRASIFLSVRTKALSTYLENNKRPVTGQGFLERCLFSTPAPNLATVATAINPIPSSGHSFWILRFEQLTRFFMETQAAGQIELDDSAQELLAECGLHYWNNIHPQIRDKDLQTYVSYQVENTAKIAIVLHLIESHLAYPGEKIAISSSIAKATMESAIALVQWHLDVYFSLFSPQHKKLPSLAQDTMKLSLWLVNKSHKISYPKGIKFIQQFNSIDFDRNYVLKASPFRQTAHLQMLLDTLHQQGKIQLYATPTGKNKIRIPFLPMGCTL